MIARVLPPRFASGIDIDRPRFASPGLHPASPQVCTWGYLLAPALRAERSLYVIVYPRFAPGIDIDRARFASPQVCTWGYLLSPASRAERSLYVIVYPRFAPGATFLHPRCGFGKGRLCRKRCASLRIGMGNEMGLGVLEWKREMPMGGLRLRGSCDV